MSILSTFSRKAPNRVFISIILGALAGVCYSALIPLVLSSIAPEDTRLVPVNEIKQIFGVDVINYKLAIVYFVACLLILIMRSASEIILVRVATDVAKDLRKKFYYQISNAPLSAIERMGSAKLIASINLDVPRIVAGGRALPSLLINAITLVGMLGFLMFLNIEVFRLVMAAIFIGAMCYQLPMLVGAKIFRQSREVQDELQASIRGLIYGAKELKLDANKRALFYREALIGHEDRIMKNDKKAQTIVRATMSFGDLISFFVIGAVSFIFINYNSITREELVGVIMALLYVTGPIGVMLSTIPTLAIASISYRKLNKLIEDIPSEDCNLELIKMPEWQTLSFDRVEYRYPSVSNEPGFHVGPLSFKIEKGEITFIVGGNGSGKSTLSKLLTLHYPPSKGCIHFGTSSVTPANISSHRLNIGAIYSDYYLFDELLLELTDEVVDKAHLYLDMFHLADKVKIVDGVFTTLALSDGQRKRLALLVAFLEDKDFYLFDEWAADQDPEFKDIFYKKILPDLKAQGKAIVVISHDDGYFSCADKVMVMKNGVLNEIEQRENKKVAVGLFTAEYQPEAECIN